MLCDNEASLDETLKERMEHNQRYNDDTIFDHLSIFKHNDEEEETGKEDEENK